MLKKVVFSERAIIALLSETQEHINTETGGIFLGYRDGSIWYIVETIDPGLNCVHQPAYFEYDDVYMNHLMNKVDRLYKKPLEILGLWHRHPGSFDRFSVTDDGANIKYARKHQDGCISALVNIDPNFRITMYHVTDPLSYRKTKYAVGDKHFPPDFLTYAARKKYLRQINHPNGFENKLWTGIKKAGKIINGKASRELFEKKFSDRKITFVNIIQAFLDEEKTKEKYAVDYAAPKELSDEELELVIENIQADLDYFEETGIKMSLRLIPSGGLELEGNHVTSDTEPDGITMFIHEEKVFLNISEKSFEYYSGMFREACESYALLGDKSYDAI